MSGKEDIMGFTKDAILFNVMEILAQQKAMHVIQLKHIAKDEIEFEKLKEDYGKEYDLNMAEIVEWMSNVEKERFHGKKAADTKTSYKPPVSKKKFR